MESKTKEKGRRASPAPRGPTTPADPSPVPQGPPSDPDSDSIGPEHLLNRELTWLNFNFRVLNEAEDERVPLLERLKFAAIVGSNLDEFFMKRIGGLKQQVGAGVQKVTSDGRTPTQQIDESHALVRRLEARRRAVLGDLLVQLEGAGVRICAFDDLGAEDQAFLRAHYFENIYPLVTPQSTDPAHPFPFVSNLSLNLLVTLRHPGEPTPFLARVKVPVGSGISRFLQLPGRSTFVTLESVMANTLDLLFPGMEVDSCHFFRVTRNANTERDEETADDLLELIQKELRDRRIAPIVRLEVEKGVTAYYRALLASELGLDEAEDVFEVEGLLGTRDLMEVMSVDFPELLDPPHSPVEHPLLVTNRPIFHSVREAGSILLHHPYQSFDTSVERFLMEASQDPKVRAIKMTLYRTSSDSAAVRHLMEAARNGKQVAVVLELKARFDEAANIRWANQLGGVGIHVTYGVVGLKTHCKVVLVVRQDYDGLRRYAHVGTGNYHKGTAELYSDIGMLTCDDGIGRDLTELFNYLTTGYKPKRNYKKLLVAPKGLKRTILKLIQAEIEIQNQGGKGLIDLKMNALDDIDVIESLYAAGRAGVRVNLMIRDTCRLRPGIPGLSETIRVRSIVGHFLEHARIYHFGNGGEDLYYIGSADSMRRNLMSRIEVLAPVVEKSLCKEIRFFLDQQWKDERGAWEMNSDGSYRQCSSPEPDAKGSQDRMIEWAGRRYREATRLKRRQIRTLHEEDLSEGL
jgi:polyphosphate kinase